jgi:hypothetical protein
MFAFLPRCSDSQDQTQQFNEKTSAGAILYIPQAFDTGSSAKETEISSGLFCSEIDSGVAV